MTDKQIREMQKEKRCILYNGALRISELYPDVERVIIKYKGKPCSANCNEKSGEQTYTCDMLAIFLVDCPNGTCTGIGFDLGYVISNMIRMHRTEESGVLECQEFEDAERYNKFHCKSRLEYTIDVEYRS